MTRYSLLAAVILLIGHPCDGDSTGTASCLLADRGATLTYAISGSSAMSGDFVSSVSGSSVLTLIPRKGAGGVNCTETVLITELVWGVMSVTASDTSRQWLFEVPGGIELFSDSMNSQPSALIPGILEPGTEWESFGGGYLERNTVISCDRTIMVPAGRFANCVMISSVRESSGATRSAVEYLAPGIGRVMMVEELASPGNWSLMLIHRLDSLEKEAGKAGSGTPADGSV